MMNRDSSYETIKLCKSMLSFCSDLEYDGTEVEPKYNMNNKMKDTRQKDVVHKNYCFCKNCKHVYEPKQEGNVFSDTEISSESISNENFEICYKCHYVVDPKKTRKYKEQIDRKSNSDEISNMEKNYEIKQKVAKKSHSNHRIQRYGGSQKNEKRKKEIYILCSKPNKSQNRKRSRSANMRKPMKNDNRQQIGRKVFEDTRTYNKHSRRVKYLDPENNIKRNVAEDKSRNMDKIGEFVRKHFKDENSEHHEFEERKKQNKSIVKEKPDKNRRNYMEERSNKGKEDENERYYEPDKHESYNNKSRSNEIQEEENSIIKNKVNTDLAVDTKFDKTSTDYYRKNSYNTNRTKADHEYTRNYKTRNEFDDPTILYQNYIQNNRNKPNETLKPKQDHRQSYLISKSNVNDIRGDFDGSNNREKENDASNRSTLEYNYVKTYQNHVDSSPRTNNHITEEKMEAPITINPDLNEEIQSENDYNLENTFVVPIINHKTMEMHRNNPIETSRLNNSDHHHHGHKNNILNQKYIIEENTRPNEKDHHRDDNYRTIKTNENIKLSPELYDGRNRMIKSNNNESKQTLDLIESETCLPCQKRALENLERNNYENNCHCVQVSCRCLERKNSYEDSKYTSDDDLNEMNTYKTKINTKPPNRKRNKDNPKKSIEENNNEYDGNVKHKHIRKDKYRSKTCDEVSKFYSQFNKFFAEIENEVNDHGKNKKGNQKRSKRNRTIQEEACEKAFCCLCKKSYEE